MIRSGLLALAAAGFLASAANAQIPNVSVLASSDIFYEMHCGAPGTLSELVIVLNNANSVVSAVDFTINYPTAIFFLYDQISDASYTGTDKTIVTIGNSQSGMAMAWHACCMPDGSQGSIVLIRPVVLWSPNCDCDNHFGGYPVTVGGYAPLGKTEPSYISYPDFVEHTALGLDMFICPGSLPVESATWGKVKALYR